MCLTENQVSIINSIINGSIFSQPRFSGSLIHGLCDVATEVGEHGSYKRYPVSFEANGNPSKVSIDDRFPVVGYHRLISLLPRYGYSEYGDEDNEVGFDAELAFVLFAQYDLLKMSVHNLIELLILALPNHIPESKLVGTGIDSMTVEFTDSDFNQMRIFNDEFYGVDFRGLPSGSIAKIKYKIVSKIRKNCIDICA